jgi:hypothetical protein
VRRTSTLIGVLAATAFLGAAVPAHALLGLGLSATGKPATNVTSSSAVLNGIVSPLSLSTSYYFDIGTTTAYGTQTPVRSVTSLLSAQTVSASVTGLKPNTTYHYRIVAGELSNVVRSNDLTFKTGSSSSDSSGSGTATDPGTHNDSGKGDDSPAATGTNSAPSFAADAPTPTGVTPVLGESVAATPASGAVRVRLPGSAMYVPLEGDASLPVGTTFDARRGTVSLLAARDSAATTQAAQFQGAVFQIRQQDDAAGLTDIYLRGGDYRPCWPSVARGLVAARAKKRKTVRRLWGHDRGGRFRTHGQRAVATVRGTTWMVADRCDGTLTKVTEGAVSVKDRARHKNVLVTAGHSYLARARR